MSVNSLENDHNRRIAYWLICCATVIFAMIILGGVTRLTRSGLSMVEWKPLVGIIPPLNEDEWQAAFEKYKQFPEYQKINIGMDLSGFKRIFLFEYAHRVLGRLIGLIFFLPFVFFYLRRQVSKALTPKLLVLFLLGGLQGLLGWYMVKSGLVDNPHVSQYRLTAHLGLAVAIYGYMLWIAFGCLKVKRLNVGDEALLDETQHKRLSRFASILSILIFIMILSGGLVAGTRAGYAFNTFPLMGDSFIPPGLFALEPVFLNFFENIVTVQFDHRMLAYVIFVLVICFSVFAFRNVVFSKIRISLYLYLLMLILQVGLGITTLLFHIPVFLGVAHQGGAILLLSISLLVSYQLRPGH